VNALQNVAPKPLLIGSDYETGVAMQVAGATRLPTNMAVGATGSEELAELKGRVTGTEAVALGVPWVLAPVLDVQNNPDNPIVNVRSFGEDPALVARLGRAFVKGLRSAGALSCAKHFPGHGDVTVDSHLELPRITADRARLDAVELRAFKDVDADSLMLAHLRVDAIDPDVPASLSAKTVTVAGFPGLVTTDALIMGGITKFCSDREAVVRAAKAGVHALLYPKDPWDAIDALIEAVKSGELDIKLVERAVARIDAMARGDRVDPARVEEVVGCAAHEEAADRIAEASITRVFGDIPAGPVRFAAVRDDSVKGDLTVFEKGLSVTSDAETGVLAVFSGYKAFSGRKGPDERQVAVALRDLAGVRRLVVVSFGNPYVRIPGATATVCAYSECGASQRAAARAIRGEIPFRGKPPVRLAGLNPA
jgi:beta-glucosidase-like glycosyl hydrolase